MRCQCHQRSTACLYVDLRFASEMYCTCLRHQQTNCIHLHYIKAGYCGVAAALPVAATLSEVQQVPTQVCAYTHMSAAT